MQPSVKTFSAAGRKALRIYLLILLLVTTLVSGYFNVVSSTNFSCPNVCKCYPSDHSNPNTFKLFRRNGMVSCQRQGLTSVPVDIPHNISRLYLSHNLITSLSARSFENVTTVSVLVLAGNLISSIENDTFHNLLDLEYLDLSNNQMRTIPELLLCPWKPSEVQSKDGLNPVQQMKCPLIFANMRTLMMEIGGNQWHCTCYLQQMIKTYSCQRNIGYPCVNFLPVQGDSSAIGYCASPPNIRKIPLNRLRAEEIQDFPRAQMVNLCLERSPHVDVVLLVVMFTWMGITMGCVMHFVAWNNREIERHKSYIAGLDRQTAANNNKAASPKSSSIRSTSNKPPSKRVPEERRNPDIAINGNIIEDSPGEGGVEKNEEWKHLIRQSSDQPSMPSPVWKPRIQTHRVRLASA